MDDAAADVYVHAVAGNWREATLTAADRALCEFAAKLTHDQKDMSPGDLETLRGVGFADRAIHDAVQVIALFNYYTRLADALGVEPETFIPPWGEP